jgi:hypothetical protein
LSTSNFPSSLTSSSACERFKVLIEIIFILSKKTLPINAENVIAILFHSTKLLLQSRLAAVPGRTEPGSVMTVNANLLGGKLRLTAERSRRENEQAL